MPRLLARARAATRSPGAIVIVIGLCIMALNIWWVQRYRQIGSLEVDETGYLAGALRYHRNGAMGVEPLLHRIAEATSGPLVPMLSTPLLVIFGRSVWIAQAVQSILHIVAAVAVTGIVRRHGSDRGALIAGIVALALPAALMLDRSYQLATGAATAMCVALWALLASERGHRTGPMIVFGLAVAAMPLSRTMAIGFVPAVAVASLINTRWNRRSLANLAAAAVACFLTAGVWWLQGWEGIMGYLQRSGYSDFAGYWGSTNFWGRFGNRADQLQVDVRVPFLIIAAIILMTVAVDVIAHRVSTGGLRAWPGLDRELVVLWTAVAGGYAALLSTPNTGTWFDLPLVFVAVAALASTVGRLRPPDAAPHPLRGLVGGLAVLVAAATVIASVAPPAGPNGERANALSLLIYADTDRMSSGNIDADPRLGSPDANVRAEAASEWEAVNHRVVEIMSRYEAESPTLVQSVTGSGHLMNINTLLLATESMNRTILSIELPVTFDPEANLRRWLEPFSDGAPRIIVRIRADSLRFPDDRFPERYDELVEELGWETAEVLPLPDGGHVDVLTHPDSDPLSAGQRADPADG